MFEEEIEALNSIYCLPGECTVVEREITMNLRISPEADNGKDIKIVIDVGEEYPNKIPEISVICHTLKRDLITDLKSKVNDWCRNLIGQPMLVSMITYIQEELQQNANVSASITHTQKEVARDTQSDSCTSADDKWTTLLHIDHMRSKTKYCKTLEKWAKELTLNGRLLFCRRLILLLLQGSLHNIKEFITRLRTVSVDVDSRGHSCKEKMMSVLAEEPCRGSDLSFSDYQILEMSKVPDLQAFFTDSGLDEMYKKYVSNIKGNF